MLALRTFFGRDDLAFSAYSADSGTTRSFTSFSQALAEVVEAMRVTGTPRLLYASGSGVYGDLGELEIAEDHGPLLPVSTYGASKLAGEALINSYCWMFGLTACAFRFGNVAKAKNESKSRFRRNGDLASGMVAQA